MRVRSTEAKYGKGLPKFYLSLFFCISGWHRCKSVTHINRRAQVHGSIPSNQYSKHGRKEEEKRRPMQKYFFQRDKNLSDSHLLFSSSPKIFTNLRSSIPPAFSSPRHFMCQNGKVHRTLISANLAINCADGRAKKNAPRHHEFIFTDKINDAAERIIDP